MEKRRMKKKEIVHVSHLIERRSLVLNECVNACQIQSCQHGGTCINNFRNINCYCIGTGYEGTLCQRGMYKHLLVYLCFLIKSVADSCLIEFYKKNLFSFRDKFSC